MALHKSGLLARLLVLATVVWLVVPAVCGAQDFKTFQSEDYGFTMDYPASWVRISKPKGNYYVVFQAPDLTDNFRNRIHVAAHEPVKDQLNVFLQELRNGIADLQKQSGRTAKEQQQVRIIDEGEFRCEVPGAHYFFIQAFEAKLNLWMDIVIVFFKHNQTLLRVSCLAPSSVMEKMQPVFNQVLTSVKFGPGERTSVKPSAQQEPDDQGEDEPAALPRQPAGPATTAPSVQPARPAPTPGLGIPGMGAQPSGPQTQDSPSRIEEAPRQIQRAPSAAPSRTGPRGGGPSRGPAGPPTGLVE